MRKLVFLLVLLCGACNGDDKVQQQLNLLDQIEKKVSLTFKDDGPAVPAPGLDGNFERFRFKFFNGYTTPVTLFRFDGTIPIPDAAKQDNPKGFLYSIEGKDTYWGEIGLSYADSRHRIPMEIAPGKSVEFVGLLNRGAPVAKGKTDVRGVVTVYVDVTDINGRHIPSASVPFPK